MIVAVLGFNSCEKDELVFTAKAPGEFAFTNNFLPQYVLTSATSANIGERFTWESQSFEVPVAVNYELQGSVTGDFTDLSIIGSTSGNDQAVTVGKLLSMAADAGLDNDPNTENPNTGDVYFRLRAYSGANAIETLSSVQTLTLFLPEIVDTGGGFAIASWGVVGSGYNDWGGAGPDGQFYTTAASGVIVSYVNLVTGDIKFRENNEWGGDVGDANLDGILDTDPDNNIAVTAGDYKITIDTNDMSYTIEPFSWGVVGSGYNNWSGDGKPLDAPFYTTSVPGVIVSYVNLLDGQIKFRENNTWGGDLGDANLDGILDADPDNNINVTAGDYKITINTNDNSYSIVPFSWGIVGNGYNNWGSGGLDAKLYYDYTTDTFKVGVKLIDGDIKIRPLNTWSGDLGDANLDGILDSDADNNIAVTAGHYLITMDLKDNSYSIVAAPVWGVVGSGYNNWGADGPDAALTEIQPGVMFGDDITLIDGDIKFRADNTWSGDLGDANADGILDADPDNNIAVTAGNYVVTIDFNDPDGPRYHLTKR